MAVPFYLPEGGADDTVSSGGTTSSDGASSSAASSLQSSPNTTTSSTQTPMQSPLQPSELIMALFNEAFYRYSLNSGSHIFQYPTPPSPSCSVHSPSYTGGGEFIFPRSRSTSRIPRTSVSFAAGDEVNFFHQSAPASSTSGNAQTQTTQAPQSAPPVPNSHHHNNQHQLYGHYPHFGYPHMGPGGSHYQYTPPPTPNTATATTSTGTSTSGAHRSLHRSLSDSARRSRLTSTGEDEREYQSEHETSWDDEFDDRYDNFTAGRERLQEFNGRIPPRKKKKDVPKTKPEKKEQSFTWPAVVTVFVFAMGCGFLVAR